MPFSRVSKILGRRKKVQKKLEDAWDRPGDESKKTSGLYHEWSLPGVGDERLVGRLFAGTVRPDIGLLLDTFTISRGEENVASISFSRGEGSNTMSVGGLRIAPSHIDSGYADLLAKWTKKIASELFGKKAFFVRPVTFPAFALAVKHGARLVSSPRPKEAEWEPLDGLDNIRPIPGSMLEVFLPALREKASEGFEESTVLLNDYVESVLERCEGMSGEEKRLFLEENLKPLYENVFSKTTGSLNVPLYMRVELGEE